MELEELNGQALDTNELAFCTGVHMGVLTKYNPCDRVSRVVHYWFGLDCPFTHSPKYNPWHYNLVSGQCLVSM